VLPSTFKKETTLIAIGYGVLRTLVI